MRVLSSQMHGVLDYVTSMVLLFSPLVLGFADGGAAQWVAVFIGMAVAGYSLITDYEYSIGHLVPMPMHLAFDAVAGLLLVVSPWLLGVAGAARWMLPLVGAFLIVIAAITARRPANELPA